MSTLEVGRRVEPFRANEVRNDVKAPILRDYLRRWKFEAGAFFEGLDAEASDEPTASVVFRVVWFGLGAVAGLALILDR